MNITLPFVIDRTSALTLIAQMSEGFRMAIESGFYKPGDVLPSMEEISAAAGVSMMVTRAAIRRLTVAGLLKPRRRTGILVLDAGRPNWRGHVLIVTSELRDNYFVATVVAKIREALGKSDYVVTYATVLLDGRKKPDYSSLDLALREPTSLVVSLTSRWGVPERIAASKIPFVCFGEASIRKKVPQIAGVFSLEKTSAIADFVAHCRAVGVKRVMEVRKPGEAFLQIGTALAAADITCESWFVESLKGPGAVRNVQRAMLDAFAQRLEKGTKWLPDVLFFDDDYRAEAALVALEHAGIRVPEDVAVVSWSVLGGSPCHWQEFTRIELDAEDAGDAFARHILSYLAGGKIPKLVAARPAYRIGDTFPFSA